MQQTANTIQNPNNFIVPSFINATYVAGRLSVGIYHMAERTTTESIIFSNAANAMDYAFSLQKRHGLYIARRAFELLLWEIQRTGAICNRAKAQASVSIK
ncbi:MULTISPECIES: hypothetical protein [Duncaniella]|uniref:Uncharacterized protein n=1 Tax=Duncaniella dubosii TaxID=2518971 RepID=A0A4P7W2J3_9BACT|nr:MULTISPECIES: hypothetical protein [Duncaniella]MBJ2190561.1 hypothetical protein [Muribaculaceae bacterium]MCX4284908.1 hypothetical protein [Duncaniella dubosii]QCD42169.1 hypothetical protein E7747_07715 [Duncaniella dubosii]